jgi:hypothetical protein
LLAGGRKNVRRLFSSLAVQTNAEAPSRRISDVTEGGANSGSGRSLQSAIPKLPDGLSR